MNWKVQDLKWKWSTSLGHHTQQSVYVIYKCQHCRTDVYNEIQGDATKKKHWDATVLIFDSLTLIKISEIKVCQPLRFL